MTVRFFDLTTDKFNITSNGLLTLLHIQILHSLLTSLPTLSFKSDTSRHLLPSISKFIADDLVRNFFAISLSQQLSIFALSLATPPALGLVRAASFAYDLRPLSISCLFDPRRFHGLSISTFSRSSLTASLLFPFTSLSAIKRRPK